MIIIVALQFDASNLSQGWWLETIKMVAPDRIITTEGTTLAVANLRAKDYDLRDHQFVRVTVQGNAVHDKVVLQIPRMLVVGIVEGLEEKEVIGFAPSVQRRAGTQMAPRKGEEQGNTVTR